MDLLEQLDLTDAVEQIDHTAVRTLDAVIHGVRITPVDFGALHVGTVGCGSCRSGTC